MSMMLRLFIGLSCFLFLFFVAGMIRRDRLLLKYALIWLAVGVAGVLMAIFPDIAVFAAKMLGFETPSNFIFFLVLLFLLAICLSLSAIVSRQSVRIKDLTQELALRTGIDVGKEG